MPRIRSVKPDFWTSDQVLECSRDARLLFIGLWNFCDDKGRHPYRPREIKARVFPADDLTQKDVLELLRELERNGLITAYTVDEQEYFYVTGWHHQRIDKPQPARYPDPFQEHSENDAGTLPPDRKGYEGIGKDSGAPRKRDEIFEAVAEVSNLSLDGLTDSERGRCNRAAKELKKVDATPDEIRRRAKIYRETWPGIDLTPNALAANWSRMKSGGKDEFDAMSYDL